MQNSVRVLLLGWEWPPKIKGGLGRHTYFLARELARAGHKVTFVAPASNLPKRSGLSGVKLVPIRISINGSYLHQVNSILRNYPWAFDNLGGEFDVIHGHDWMAVEPALRLRRKLGIPFVFTLHSSERDRSGEKIKSSKVAETEKKGVETADKVITVSNFMKRQIRQWGVKRRIAVIPNGVELKKRSVQRGNVVLFVGRLTEQKGAEYFALATADVTAKARFVVVGEGHLRKRLENFSKMVGARLEFLGFVSEKKLERLYGEAAVVVVPSTFEPFGIVPLEALAHGRPLVLSRHAGVAEFLEDGKNVLLVPERNPKKLAEAIGKILADQKLAQRLGAAGRRKAEQFDWKRIAATTLAIYAQSAKKSLKNSRSCSCARTRKRTRCFPFVEGSKSAS